MNPNDELHIDKYNLDEELIRQPQKYYDWGKAAAVAAFEKDDLKDRLEILKAKVEKQIRKDPESYGIDDVKEAAIKSAIRLDKRVREMHKKLIRAIYNERVLEEARKSFQQRKNMLESLTQLNVQLHFADPKVGDRKTRRRIDHSYQEEMKNSISKKRLKNKKKITRR